MSDEYVRKDVYDANMAEIRALMAASEARHERLTEEIRGEVRELRGEFKALSQQVEGLADTIAAYVAGFSNRIAWAFGIFGGMIGLAAVIVAGVQVYLAVK